MGRYRRWGGWAAASGSLNFDAGILFLILFLWQHPHFYAIAWMLKDDYEKGGFKMLPVEDRKGERTFRQIFWYSLLLIPISLIPTIRGISGYFYFGTAALSGIILFVIAVMFGRTKSYHGARKLLKATVYYLPVLFVLIILDTTF